MAAVGGGSLKYIQLPKNTTIHDLPRVQEIVRSEYAKHEGVPLFGATVGWFFVYTPTDGIVLNVESNEVENGHRIGRFWPQSISIQSRI